MKKNARGVMTSCPRPRCVLAAFGRCARSPLPNPACAPGRACANGRGDASRAGWPAADATRRGLRSVTEERQTSTSQLPRAACGRAARRRTLRAALLWCDKWSGRPRVTHPAPGLTIDRISVFAGNFAGAALGMDTDDIGEWAHQHFGGLDLGTRAGRRAVSRWRAGLPRRPGGRVLDVYRTSAQRQGAYDFLENPAIKSEAMVDGIGLAVASNCQEHPYVLVSVDGSSLNIVDRNHTKGFGVVGNLSKSAED